jgi:hypothetical protein
VQHFRGDFISAAEKQGGHYRLVLICRTLRPAMV